MVHAQVASSDLVETYEAMKIKVDPEVMSFFLSKLPQKRSTIAKRILCHQSDLEEWC